MRKDEYDGRAWQQHLVGRGQAERADSAYVACQHANKSEHVHVVHVDVLPVSAYAWPPASAAG